MSADHAVRIENFDPRGLDPTTIIYEAFYSYVCHHRNGKKHEKIYAVPIRLSLDGKLIGIALPNGSEIYPVKDPNTPQQNEHVVEITVKTRCRVSIGSTNQDLLFKIVMDNDFKFIKVVIPDGRECSMTMSRATSCPETNAHL